MKSKSTIPQFHPIIATWFKKQFGEPSPPQKSRMSWDGDCCRAQYADFVAHRVGENAGGIDIQFSLYTNQENDILFSSN